MLEAHDRMIRAFFGAKAAVTPRPPSAGTNRRDHERQTARDHHPRQDADLGRSAAEELAGVGEVVPHPVRAPEQLLLQARAAASHRGVGQTGSGRGSGPGTTTASPARRTTATSPTATATWSGRSTRSASPPPGARRKARSPSRWGPSRPTSRRSWSAPPAGRWKPSGGEFTWDLSPGKNRLEMRVRNVSGVEGPVSWLEVEKK